MRAKKSATRRPGRPLYTKGERGQVAMHTHGLRRIVDYLHRVVPEPSGAPTDAQLLGRFVAQRDDDAFTVLVCRHGPMVWGVCQRVLRHRQDAEDAFQATFMLLARKASTIQSRQ